MVLAISNTTVDHRYSYLRSNKNKSEIMEVLGMNNWMAEEKAKSYVGQHVYNAETGFKAEIVEHCGRNATYGNVWYVYTYVTGSSAFLTESDVWIVGHLLGDMAIAIYGN